MVNYQYGELGIFGGEIFACKVVPLTLMWFWLQDHAVYKVTKNMFVKLSIYYLGLENVVEQKTETLLFIIIIMIFDYMLIFDIFRMVNV